MRDALIGVAAIYGPEIASVTNIAPRNDQRRGIMIDTIGTAAAFLMPFFNIPMIYRLIHRKRSDDVSLVWIGGVWICTVLMTPKALTSPDMGFKLFGISNILFFTVNTFLVFYYRIKPGK